MEIKIRTVRPEDAGALADIYSYYVENTAITFEYDAPDEAEFRRRIAAITARYPFVIAEADGEVAGYGYTGAFKERAAYDWAVETSIYVRNGAQGRGIGSAIYDALEKISAKQHVTNMNACIAYTEIEDEFLTNGSTRFHEASGYSMVGRFHKCGYKFGRWYDMVWMEKIIADHPEKPEKFVPFAEIEAVV